MKTIEFYGYSDDLAEYRYPAEGEYSGEEFDCFDMPVVARVEAGGEAMFVTWLYTPQGTWSIGFAQADDGAPLPDWEMEWSLQPRHDGSPGYSTKLTMWVPDDVTVRRVKKWEDHS